VQGGSTTRLHTAPVPTTAGPRLDWTSV